MSRSLFRRDALQRRGDQIFLLLLVQSENTRGRRRRPGASRVQELVSSGQLKFFLLDGSAGNATMAAVEVWVENSCATVPAKDYAGASSNGPETLYECHA